MYSPGTLVSKFSRMRGMSIPRFSVPNTSWIASIGQERSHSPWPMQRAGPITFTLPSINPNTSPSGHTSTQLPVRMQPAGSITGWRVTGSCSP